jgi:hypothetical protein
LKGCSSGAKNSDNEGTDRGNSLARIWLRGNNSDIDGTSRSNSLARILYQGQPLWHRGDCQGQQSCKDMQFWQGCCLMNKSQYFFNKGHFKGSGTGPTKGSELQIFYYQSLYRLFLTWYAAIGVVAPAVGLNLTLLHLCSAFCSQCTSFESKINAKIFRKISSLIQSLISQ